MLLTCLPPQRPACFCPDCSLQGWFHHRCVGLCPPGAATGDEAAGDEPPDSFACPLCCMKVRRTELLKMTNASGQLPCSMLDPVTLWVPLQKGTQYAHFGHLPEASLEALRSAAAAAPPPQPLEQQKQRQPEQQPAASGKRRRSTEEKQQQAQASPPDGRELSAAVAVAVQGSKRCKAEGAAVEDA